MRLIRKQDEHVSKAIVKCIESKIYDALNLIQRYKDSECFTLDNLYFLKEVINHLIEAKKSLERI